jgi:transposase InsO family protein
VYFLKNKSEVLSKFSEYVALTEKQTGRKVQIVRSDNGGEYTSRAFQEFCRSRGIVHQTSLSYSPEQNGFAERLNRTLGGDSQKNAESCRNDEGILG